MALDRSTPVNPDALVSRRTVGATVSSGHGRSFGRAHRRRVVDSEHGPELLDRRGVSSVYGLSRVDVDRVFRALPVVGLPGSRKVYVRRSDLDELLERSTYAPGSVRCSWRDG
jgi:hypothetical protein